MAPASIRENTSFLLVQVVCSILVLMAAMQMRNVFGNNCHMPPACRGRKPTSFEQSCAHNSKPKVFSQTVILLRKPLGTIKCGNNTNCSIFSTQVMPTFLLYHHNHQDDLCPLSFLAVKISMSSVIPGWTCMLKDKSFAFVIYPPQTSAYHYSLKAPSARTNDLAFGLIDTFAHWN